MKYLLIFLLLSGVKLKGQNAGPISAAMGSGGTAVSGTWSLQQNPAGIANLRGAQITIGYERHFLDAELSTKTALFALPFRRSAVGAAFHSYGIKEYNELQAGFFYAKSFGESFQLAIGARYHQLSISRYGSARAYTIEAGFQLKLTDEITIASHLSNPNQSRYSNASNVSLPVRLSFGTACTLGDKILIVADVRKVLSDPLDAMTGIEYKVIKWFALRSGVSANPFKQYAGFGITNKKIQFDVAVSSHAVLGFSPQIALGYEL